MGLVSRDLAAIYRRDVYKWLWLAPLTGIVVGLLITGVAWAILTETWGHLMPLYYAHHWLIVPMVVAGFLITGLIMQFLTSNPDLHSTEEIIRSYHEHAGD